MQRAHGYTIVEILIVVVVIGILAAISLVSYTGIQQNAAAVVLKSDLKQASTQLELDRMQTGSYPSYNSDGNGIPKSNNTTYQYTTSGSTYCLSATSTQAGAQAFHISSTTGTVETGVCAGHSGPGSVIPMVAGGQMFSLALDTDGQLYAWGLNTNGQLGDGTTTQRNSPIIVNGGDLSGKKIVYISAGDRHSLAIDEDGQLYAWGLNTNGQLGDGTTTQRESPVAISGGALAGKTIVAAAAGTNHSIALDSNGSVYAWGSNSQGQLGDGTTTQQTLPVAITSGDLAGKNITAVGAATNYIVSIALDSDGQVYAWGDNVYGVLGDGTTTRRTSPVSISGGALSGKTISKIVVGRWHVMAIDTSGALYGWGGNSFTGGQLGDGTEIDRHTPILINGGALSGKTISAASGNASSLAIDPSGQLYAWGNNSNGQLGDGTTLKRLTPITITGGDLAGKKIVSAAAGTMHSIALDDSGQVYAWGSNSQGQLGDGTTTQRETPVEIDLVLYK